MMLRADENRYFGAGTVAAGNTNVTLREIADHDHGTIGAGVAESRRPGA